MLPKHRFFNFSVTNRLLVRANFWCFH